MLRLAALADHFGVQTALHGPSDCSPVGMMANLMLDLAVPNFGIQEYNFGHGDAVHNNIGGDRSSFGGGGYGSGGMTGGFGSAGASRAAWISSSAAERCSVA